MEEVILVNENDVETGVMEKMEAHHKGALHRAFSVFVFNDKNEMLLQQRAFSKYHSGGLWTNSCCSHPRPGEETLEAATRRLKEEMGFETALHKIFDFTYKAHFENGLTEHEFDHVFSGHYNGVVHPNPDEVCGFEWLSMDAIGARLEQNPSEFTAWFRIAFPKISEWKQQGRE